MRAVSSLSGALKATSAATVGIPLTLTRSREGRGDKIGGV